MTTPPVLLDDLKWMGFGLLSNANNHATDYGTGGLMATLEHLRAAGLPCAGAGANLARGARAGLCGHAAPAASASWPRPRSSGPGIAPPTSGRIRPGGPGINPLGFATAYTVDATVFAELKRGSERLGLTAGARAPPRRVLQRQGGAEPTRTTSSRSWAASSAKATAFTSPPRSTARTPRPTCARSRRRARQADWVIFSFHSHEFGAGGRLTAATDVGMEEMADFYVEFAHAAIDAGADVVAGHGPHLTLGVEVYRGRPILYSLGNFIFQNDTVEMFPAEAYQRFGLPHEATPADFLDARTDGDRRGFPASRRILARARGRMRVPRAQARGGPAASARPRPWPPARATRPAGARPRRRRAAHAGEGRSTFAALRDQDRDRRRNRDDSAGLTVRRRQHCRRGTRKRGDRCSLRRNAR